MIGRAVLGTTAAACISSAAFAQLAVGLISPRNFPEAVYMAQVMQCTAAPSGRIAEGLNVPMPRELTGVQTHDSVPAALAARLRPLGAATKILSLDSPGGQVWIVFDPDARTCMVTGIAEDPAAIRAKLALAYESEGSPWHATSAGPGLKQFEWDVRATPKLGTPAVRLRATFDLSDSAGTQFVLTTQAVN